MTLNDLNEKSYYLGDYKNSEVKVNVAGFMLPLENVRIKDGEIHLIISASALEDREIEIHKEKI
jgi:hypothetical protein